MADEKLIWIRSDKLKDQLTEGIYFDLLNKAVVTKSEQFTDFQWVAFDSGTETGRGAELISDLKNTYHGIPPVLEDSSYPEEPENSGNSNQPEEPENTNNSNQNDKNKILWGFVIRANNLPWKALKGWDQAALENRINSINGVKVKSINLIGEKFFNPRSWLTPSRQAKVKAYFPKSWNKTKIKKEVSNKVDHIGITKPGLVSIEKGIGKDEEVKDPGEQIPWGTIRNFAIGGMALYGLNTISNFTGEE